jgi:PleD family two-component response regulator
MDPVEQHARALLKLADDRLLDAKRRGRNCVVIG